MSQSSKRQMRARRSDSREAEKREPFLEGASLGAGQSAQSRPPSLSDVSKLLAEYHRSYLAKGAGLSALTEARCELRTRMRALNTKHNIGRKVSMLGFALTVLSPDPFTDVAGLPLLVLGRVLSRVYSSITIEDLMKEAKASMEALDRERLI